MEWSMEVVEAYKSIIATFFQLYYTYGGDGIPPDFYPPPSKQQEDISILILL